MIHDILDGSTYNTKDTSYYTIPGTDLVVPVAVINGKQSGKTLLITAGIHGSEYPGIEACRKLINDLDPELIQGKIIILPCVNINAFFERTAFINPADQKNLNRSFPGKKNGTETEKIAFTLANVFFSEADFYLDLHSGDLPEALTSFVFIPGFGSKEVLRQVNKAVNYLDLSFGVKSAAKTGAYNYASIQGTPSLLIERGCCGGREQQHTEGFIKDVYGIMEYLEMIPSKNRRKEIAVLNQVSYLNSLNKGLWFPNFKVGEQVEKGASIGTVEDFFGTKLGEYFAEHDGKILYQWVSLPIEKGDPLIAYGK